jgi:hypothetical protein
MNQHQDSVYLFVKAVRELASSLEQDIKTAQSIGERADDDRLTFATSAFIKAHQGTLEKLQHILDKENGDLAYIAKAFEGEC